MIFKALLESPETLLPFVTQMGRSFAQAQFMKCKNPGMGEIMFLTMLTEDISPLVLQQRYHIMDGQFSPRSDWLSGEFQRIGGVVEWLDLGNDAKLTFRGDALEEASGQATAKFKFKNHDMVISFAMQEAVRTGLAKKGSGYEKDPGAQLRARVMSRAIRIVAPEMIAGMYVAEELGEDESQTPPQPTAETKHSPQKPNPAADKPAKPSKSSPSQEELDKAAKDAKDKLAELMAKGEKLASESPDRNPVKEQNYKDNAETKSDPPATTPAPDAAFATAVQIAELKKLYEQATVAFPLDDYPAKFKKAFDHYGVKKVTELTPNDCQAMIDGLSARLNPKPQEDKS